MVITCPSSTDWWESKRLRMRAEHDSVLTEACMWRERVPRTRTLGEP